MKIFSLLSETCKLVTVFPFLTILYNSEIGAPTFSMTTLNMMTLSITTLNIIAQHYENQLNDTEQSNT